MMLNNQSNCSTCLHWQKGGKEIGKDGCVTGRRWCRFRKEYIAYYKGSKCLLWKDGTIDKSDGSFKGL